MRLGRGEVALAFGLLLASLAVRLAFLEWRGVVLFPDSAEYLLLAKNLAGSDEHGFKLDSGIGYIQDIQNRRADMQQRSLTCCSGSTHRGHTGLPCRQIRFRSPRGNL